MERDKGNNQEGFLWKMRRRGKSYKPSGNTLSEQKTPPEQKNRLLPAYRTPLSDKNMRNRPFEDQPTSMRIFAPWRKRQTSESRREIPEEDNSLSTGERILRAQRDADITQKEVTDTLSERTHNRFGSSRFHNMTRGTAYPSQEELKIIAELTNSHPDELKGYDWDKIQMLRTAQEERKSRSPRWGQGRTREQNKKTEDG